MLVDLWIDTEVPHLFHGQYLFVVNLYSEGKRGRVGLKKIGPRLLETHSSLDDALQNKGLGILMYSHAIQLALDNGYKICSSEHIEMTPEAESLWESKRLREEYSITRSSDRFWVVV